MTNDNKPENLKPDNFLSDEEQKNFDKCMKDYESQNDRITEIYNDNSQIKKVAKNKNVIMAAIGICFLLCLGGIAHSFMNISDTGVSKKDTQIAEQKKAQTDADSKANQEKLEQKQNEDKQKAEESKDQAQNKKELNDIKNNFHPWDEGNSGMTNPQTIPQSHSFNASNNMENNQSASNASRQSPVIVNSPAPAPVVNASSDTTTVVTDDSEWMSLKGIAIDRNGNSICYIKNGISTNAYHEGDVVGDYRVSSINNSYVVVSDSDGNTMNLNK